jgi:hypothetical protein
MESMKFWFHLFALCIFTLNFMWWKTSNWLNLAIRILFFIGMVWGIIIVLNDMGIIIKP